jgi:hypothetical protein
MIKNRFQVLQRTAKRMNEISSGMPNDGGSEIDLFDFPVGGNADWDGMAFDSVIFADNRWKEASDGLF